MLRLQYERQKRRGLSQDDLAVATRLHQPVVSMIENGRLVPTSEQLRSLADALGVHPPERLLEHVVLVEAR